MIEKAPYFANCHNHSRFSDGAFWPEEIVARAKSYGYGAIMLTDHDTVAGQKRMLEAARSAGMLSTLGCEFSTAGFDGAVFHLLGYDFDPSHPKMQALLSDSAERATVHTKITFDYAVECGRIKEITWNDVLSDFPENDFFCYTQVFFTLKARGALSDDDYPHFMRENFSNSATLPIEDRLFRAHSPTLPDVLTVAKIIREAGGVPIIAHPHGQYKYALDLISGGILGFEVRHPDLTDVECGLFRTLCLEKHLYKLGGTDHTGPLGGYMHRGGEYLAPMSRGGTEKEDFIELYERRLG